MLKAILKHNNISGKIFVDCKKLCFKPDMQFSEPILEIPIKVFKMEWYKTIENSLDLKLFYNPNMTVEITKGYECLKNSEFLWLQIIKGSKKEIVKFRNSLNII